MARRAVRSMMASSPACPPHAMLAEVTCSINAASCAASSSSPMSQLRSIGIIGLWAYTLVGLHKRIQPFLLFLEQVPGAAEGDFFEAHGIARAGLAELP